MNKDRIVGSAKELKGKIKEGAGKAVGDAKLEAEGKADKVEGKIQNAVGGVKDAIKRKLVAAVAVWQGLNRGFFASILPDIHCHGASDFRQWTGRRFRGTTADHAPFQLVTIPVTKRELRR